MGCLFFSSPIGLGHAARDAAVACCLESGVRFVTGGAAAEFLRRSGFEVADRYVPPKFTVEDGVLKRPLGWLWRYYRYYRDCKRAASEIIGREAPDVVVSDEDFASLAVARERNIPSVLITDVLETRFAKWPGSLIEKRMNRSMREIMSGCDAVIVPEEGADEGNVRRTGPIVRRTRFSRDELRGRLGFDKKTVVISVGGTAAGSFLIEKALQSVRKTKRDFDVVVVPGPSLEGEFGGVRNLGFVENLHEVIYASDLVISLAGRSTMDEADAYGTPGIFIPIKNHFEQEDNAARQGFTHDDVLRLDSLIEERIACTRRRIAADGAQRACGIINKLANAP